MKLFPEEVETAAARLCRSSLGKSLSDLPSNEQQALRMLVEGLAAQLGGERSPAALRVFYLWMGDDPAN